MNYSFVKGDQTLGVRREKLKCWPFSEVDGLPRASCRDATLSRHA
jgi:hypothetical protein